MNRLVVCHTLPALSTALLLTVANAGFSSAKQPVGEAMHLSKRARPKASDYRFRKSGSFAIFAVTRRASSIVSTLATLALSRVGSGPL
jgi:hypothetical protein